MGANTCNRAVNLRRDDCLQLITYSGQIDEKVLGKLSEISLAVDREIEWWAKRWKRTCAMTVPSIPA